MIWSDEKDIFTPAQRQGIPPTTPCHAVAPNSQTERHPRRQSHGGGRGGVPALSAVILSACGLLQPGGAKDAEAVVVVAHRLEDVRLEQADAAARRTPVPAPPVLGEHLVIDEQFAYLHELLHFFAELPAVTL